MSASGLKSILSSSTVTPDSGDITRINFWLCHRHSCMQWRREAKGDMRRGRHCAGAAFGGAKIWNSEIWPLLANWLLHCRTDSAHYVITPPQLSVLFVTVHTNAIVVSSIRISIADLIGGGGNTDVCPRRQTPSRRHWLYEQLGYHSARRAYKR